MDDREKYNAAMNGLEIDKNLGENIAKRIANDAALEEEGGKKRKKEKNAHGFTGWRVWEKALAGLCAFAICVTSAVGIGGGFAGSGRKTTVHPIPDNGTKSETVECMTAKTYDDVYQQMKALGVFDRNSYYNGVYNYTYAAKGDFKDYEVVYEAAPEAPAAAKDDSADDYSTTNLQVAGVDEADIVKTNGKYIFALESEHLYIVSAAGKDSEILFEKDLRDEKSRAVTDGTEVTNAYPREMYLAGDTLIVIRNRSTWIDYSEEYWNTGNRRYIWGWYGNSESFTEALYYDVSDPTNPSLVKSVAQDGGYLSSRVTDGVLYLISNYYVRTIDESDMPELDPSCYVPCTYACDDEDATGGEETPVNATCIAILPHIDSTCYLTITGFDAVSGDYIGNQSILGGGDTVYMSADNLFVANSVYSGYDPVSVVTREDGATVRTFMECGQTEFLRIALGNGHPELMATAKVDGYILNQFAMDEYDNTFRTVTTVDSWSYKEITPKEGEFNTDDYRYYGYTEDWKSETTSNVYVFDMDMNVIGSIEGLSDNERVYSVRFDGEVGYIVTFRQMDPLFAIDFTNPKNPEIRSALKIPGFSEYMHVYKDGLLFGLGYNADVESGRTEDMKMSMFDVSDPFNVTEITSHSLDTYYSEALYNHKAILVNAEKNLIAFPAEYGYLIYGYDEATETFFEKGNVSFRDKGNWWYWGDNARGLYSGNCFYVVSSTGLYAIDMDTFEVVQTIEWPYSPYSWYGYDVYAK